MRTIILSIFLFLIYPLVAYAETLYVRPSGTCSNNGDGTVYACAAAPDGEGAWNAFSNISWGAGTGQVGAGDTLYVCGTHTEKLTIGADGSDGNSITIRGDYSGDPGQINAANLQTECIRIENEYIKILNLTVRDPGAEGIGTGIRVRDNHIVIDGASILDGFADYAIRLDSNAIITDIEILNCTITDSPTTNDSTGAIGGFQGSDFASSNISIHDNIVSSNYTTGVGFGIMMYPDDGSVSSVNIYNNTIHDVKRTGINIANAVTSCNVYGNTVYNCGTNGIHVGGATKGTATAEVYDNIVYQTNKSGGADGSGVFFDAYSDSCKAYRNWIYDSEENGIKLSSSSNHEVYYNLVKGSSDIGIEVRRSDPYSTNNIKIYNNTVVHEQSAAIEVNEGNPGGGGAILVKNNICYNSGSGTYGIYISSGSTVTEDYNDVYNFTTNFADENGAIPKGTNSIISNPSLTNLSNNDFRLQSNSSCINTGADLGSSYDDAFHPLSSWPDGVQTDLQGNHGTGWEIGVYLYIPAIAGGGGIEGGGLGL